MWHNLDSEKVLEQDDSNGHAVSDETLLMQITTNLASGACKFTFPRFTAPAPAYSGVYTLQ
jgi:hypothetical protein